MLIYALDDEIVVLRYTEKSLRSCCPDAEIIGFTDEDLFLSAFSLRPADVVFLDIEMPGMSGIDLAKRLNEIKNNLNIIFVTGYDQYALEAFNVYASDYLKKPCTTDKILKSLGKLRYPVTEIRDIVVRTFGNFDVFYKNVPISFRSEMEKELLAYLVDREGALVSRQEIAGVLFEDDFSRSKQAQLSKLASRLSEDLSAAGAEGLFFIENGYRVDLTLCTCDLTEWKSGNKDFPFSGEYMEQYSFGEYRKAALSGMKPDI